MDANSVLVGRSLINAATSEHVDVLPSPTEPADEAGEQCLGSGL